MEEAICLKYFKEKLTESEDFKMYITVRSLRAVMLHCGSFQSVVPLFLFGIVKKTPQSYMYTGWQKVNITLSKMIRLFGSLELSFSFQK